MRAGFALIARIIEFTQFPVWRPKFYKLWYSWANVVERPSGWQSLKCDSLYAYIAYILYNLKATVNIIALQPDVWRITQLVQSNACAVSVCCSDPAIDFFSLRRLPCCILNFALYPSRHVHDDYIYPWARHAIRYRLNWNVL